jgi:hypothetical protein
MDMVAASFREAIDDFGKRGVSARFLISKME